MPAIHSMLCLVLLPCLALAADVERGIQAAKEGNQDLAITCFTAHLREHPTDVAVLLRRAESFLCHEQFDKAVADCNQAIRLDPKNADAHCKRGDAFAETSKLKKALADYNEAIRLDPKIVAAYSGRASVYIEQEEFDKAIADYTEAIRLDPKNGDVYVERAEAYFEKAEDEKAMSDRLCAISAYTEAILRDPKNVNALRGRADSHAAVGQFDNAIADYTEVIRFDPKDICAYTGRGLAYSNKDKIDKAIADLIVAIRLDPKEPVAHHNLAMIYSRKEQFDKVIAEETKAIELGPKHAGKGRRDDIETVANAYHCRAGSYLKKGEFDKAIADYTEAIRFDSACYAQDYSARGYAHWKKGELGEAIADYTERIRADPTNDDAHYNRACLYAEKGEFAQAIADLNESIRLNPLGDWKYSGLGWLLATCPKGDVRNGDKALEFANKACKETKGKYFVEPGSYEPTFCSDPDHPISLETRAAAYAEIGEFSRAVKYQKEALEHPRFDAARTKAARNRLKLYEDRKPFRDEEHNGAMPLRKPVLLPCFAPALVDKPEPQAATKAKPSIQWRTDYDAARREAAQKKLPLFIFTTFKTCFWAHKMEAETLSDSRIVGLLNERFIPVKVYAERNPTVIESFHVQSFPTTVICACDGRILRAIEGNVDLEHLLPKLVAVTDNAADHTASDIRDEDRIQGTWAVVSVKSGGESLPKNWIAGIKVTIRGNEVVIPWKNCTDNRTLKLTPGGKPKKLELTGKNGVDLGLYELERGRLIVGFPDSGRERPKNLSGKKGSNCLRITLKRDERETRPAPTASVMDGLPEGWKLVEIAKAALPGATSGSTYVLAWKRIGDERPVLVDYCLVLTHIPDYCGRERWDICSVARNPDDPKDGEWHIVHMHILGYKGFPQGAWVFQQECFDKLPSNKEVYKFADEFAWRFDVDGDWKLLDANVCKGTWEAILQEKPTRDFPKK